MGGAGILRQFLVSLGFRVDGNSLGAFNRAAALTTRGAVGIGRAAVWASVAVTGMVAVMARQLEKLYFVTLRTGESAENIEAFAFGAERAGIAADRARGMLANFALLLQTDPSKLPLLRAFGVTADTADAQLNQLVHVLGRYHPMVQKMFGEMFGLDYGDMVAMRKTEGIRAAQQREVHNVLYDYGVDLQLATENAAKFQTALDNLGLRFSTLGKKFFQDVSPWFEAKIKDLTALVDRIAGAEKQGAAPTTGLVGPGARGAAVSGARDFLSNQLVRFMEFMTPAYEDYSESMGRGVKGFGPSKAELRDMYASEEALRILMQAPTVNVTINTTDPHTTVDVDGRVVGQVPLGPDQARAGASPAR